MVQRKLRVVSPLWVVLSCCINHDSSRSKRCPPFMKEEGGARQSIPWSGVVRFCLSCIATIVFFGTGCGPVLGAQSIRRLQEGNIVFLRLSRVGKSQVCQDKYLEIAPISTKSWDRSPHFWSLRCSRHISCQGFGSQIWPKLFDRWISLIFLQSSS